MSNKIDSNITGLAYAEEATLGNLPVTPIWRAMEPNSYANLGGDVKTVARAPINASRQRRKGTAVDIDSGCGFNHDFLQQAFLRPAQSFFFAAAREKVDTQNLAGTSAVALTAVTATQFQAAAGLASFKAKDIVFASGMGAVANNGIHVLSASAAGSITTTGLTAEAAPPATARVQVVGVQFATADVNLTKTATALTMDSTLYDFTTLGLTPGEWVYLGADAAGNRFVNNQGYARVYSIAAHSLVFDQMTFAGATELGTAKDIRMFFGTVLRNELASNLITTRSLQFERQLGSDGVGIQSEYVVGAVGNELTLNIPKADKIAVDLTFVGIDSEQRTGTVGVKAGTRVAAAIEDLFNTSSDVVRQYLAIIDPATMNPSALFGYVEEGKITIGNGVTPDKAVGVFGAFDVSAGDFMVGGSVTAYFTTVAAVAAIRNNSDCTYNVIAAKQNTGFVFDIPLMGIGGGKLTVEKDKAVMMPIEQSGFENPLGYTMMYCDFAYLPTLAMPS